MTEAGITQSECEERPHPISRVIVPGSFEWRSASLQKRAALRRLAARIAIIIASWRRTSGRR